MFKRSAFGGSTNASPATVVSIPEHQYTPKRILPIAMPRKVLDPFRSHRPGLSRIGREPAFVEQVFGPVAQRTAQPGLDGNGKAHLRPLDKAGGTWR